MTEQSPYPTIPDDKSDFDEVKTDTFRIDKNNLVIQAADRHTDPLDEHIPRRLRFVVLHTNDQFEVNVRLYMVLGRKVNPRDRKIDIDLTPFADREHGVSRYHSYIQVVDNRISITDFNSTNGTYVNNKILQPSKAYRLRDGDQINLGTLELKVYFVGIADVD